MLGRRLHGRPLRLLGETRNQQPPRGGLRRRQGTSSTAPGQQERRASSPDPRNAGKTSADEGLRGDDPSPRERRQRPTSRRPRQLFAKPWEKQLATIGAGAERRRDENRSDHWTDAPSAAPDGGDRQELAVLNRRRQLLSELLHYVPESHHRPPDRHDQPAQPHRPQEKKPTKKAGSAISQEVGLQVVAKVRFEGVLGRRLGAYYGVTADVGRYLIRQCHLRRLLDKSAKVRPTRRAETRPRAQARAVQHRAIASMLGDCRMIPVCAARLARRRQLLQHGRLFGLASTVGRPIARHYASSATCKSDTPRSPQQRGERHGVQAGSAKDRRRIAARGRVRIIRVERPDWFAGTVCRDPSWPCSSPLRERQQPPGARHVRRLPRRHEVNAYASTGPGWPGV